MKKKMTVKLKLSRETLRELESSDVRKVLGGFSVESNCPPNPQSPLLYAGCPGD